MESRGRAPPVQWAQRKEVVFVGVLVEDVVDLTVDFEPERLRFSGKAGPERRPYELDIELFAEIEPENSRYLAKDRQVDVMLKKKDPAAASWPRLLKSSSKPGWLKIDFDKWKEEDEEGGDDEDKADDFQNLLKKMGMNHIDKPVEEFEEDAKHVPGEAILTSDDEDDEMPKLEG